MRGNPYEHPGWRGALRPGGLGLTQRLLSLADLPPRARILDVGCGEGESCAWLRDRGCEAAGLDCSAALIERGRARFPGVPLYVGDAAAPPASGAPWDALLFQCALSAMEAPAALSGCLPLLRPGGVLLCSDLYARGEAEDAGLPALRTRGQWEALFRSHGLRPLGFEDQSRALGSFLAQKLMDGEELGALLCRPLDEFRRARAGYCLLWARLEGEVSQ